MLTCTRGWGKAEGEGEEEREGEEEGKNPKQTCAEGEPDIGLDLKTPGS